MNERERERETRMYSDYPARRGHGRYLCKLLYNGGVWWCVSRKGRLNRDDVTTTTTTLINRLEESTERDMADLVVDRHRATQYRHVRNDVSHESRCRRANVHRDHGSRFSPRRGRSPFPFITSLATCKRSYWAISSAVKGPVCNLVTIKN